MSNDVTIGEPSMVLTFIGVKMLIAPWYHVPVAASLSIVAVRIGSDRAPSSACWRHAGHRPHVRRGKAVAALRGENLQAMQVIAAA